MTIGRPKKENKKKSLSCSVEPLLYEKITKEAKKKNLPRSIFVAQILDAALKNKKEAP
jgi:hypothetical protein